LATSSDIFPRRLFMVGCGNMAGQMLSRWLACGLDAARVTVLRPSGKPVAPGVAVVAGFPDRLEDGTVVLLGMKPHQFEEVAGSLAGVALGDILFVSILAGRLAAPMAERLGKPVVRAMPNTPVGVGQGVCALYADPGVDAGTRETVTRLMTPLGLVEWLDDEAQFNLVTALSGCGPAYLFRFIDALAVAAARLGLPADQSARLALATVRGAATLAWEAGESPAVLADRVASPGGMTRKGMDVLDADARLIDLLTETVRAARDRGEELAGG
jgi:pyrroline-5-carboxylate reductase